MKDKPEHAAQVAVIDWKNAHIDQVPCLEWLHSDLNDIPLAGNPKTRGRIVNYMKAEGMVPGILDLSLDAARRGYHGLKLEMKIHPNKPTGGQIEYMDYLASEDYLAEVCYSAKQAVALLKWYLDIECDCVSCQLAAYDNV